MPAIMIGETTAEQILLVANATCDYGYDWLIVTMVDNEEEEV